MVEQFDQTVISGFLIGWQRIEVVVARLINAKPASEARNVVAPIFQCIHHQI